jgi:cell wall-associated NlpC family hydrolase
VGNAFDNAITVTKQAGTAVQNAASTVNTARGQVENLISEFGSRAGQVLRAAEAAAVINPGAQLAAVNQAKQLATGYISDATKILENTKTSLAGLAGQVARVNPGDLGVGGSLGTDGVTIAAPPTTASSAPPRTGGGSGGGGGGGGGGAPAGGKPIITPPSTQFGSGTEINLPNGLGTVNAPNERSAIALRAALTQLGVPYVWGGATPGSGLDCSGLTQYAYGQAGVELPHYSGAQATGMRVSLQDLQPGDLIVWEGHVAMYVGNGKMIEEPHTGAVCQIVPLRTSGGGHPLIGYYRPSA